MSRLNYASSTILLEITRLTDKLLANGWGETTHIRVPWRQGFRHPTMKEYMGWFAQMLADALHQVKEKEKGNYKHTSHSSNIKT